MPSKPPFHKQETGYSCVPACLRMVLGSFGLDVSEIELRARCDTTPLYGTEAPLHPPPSFRSSSREGRNNERRAIATG
ncbi:MAG: cysteine peptidase family C39 domain-containing protein [Blastocatellia bacterium]